MKQLVVLGLGLGLLFAAPASAQFGTNPAQQPAGSGFATNCTTGFLQSAQNGSKTGSFYQFSCSSGVIACPASPGAGWTVNVVAPAAAVRGGGVRFTYTCSWSKLPH